MEKNTVWAIVLSTIVLVVFMVIQTTFFPAVSIENTTIDQSNQNVSELINTTNNTAKNESENILDKVSSENISDENVFTETYYTITTNNAKITFTNRGGDIVSYELLNHKDGDLGVQMADNITENNRAFSVSFGNRNNPIINDVFEVKQINDYTIGFFKNYEIKNSDGSISSFVLAKKYEFLPDDYMFRLDISIDGDENFKGLNFEDAAYTIRTSPQIGPYFNVKNNKYEYRNFMSFSNNKKKKTMITPGQTKEFNKPYTWTGVAGKYFEIIGIPVNNSSMKDSFYSCVLTNNDYFNSQVMMTRNPISSNNNSDVYYFYVGPRTEQDLKIYNQADKNGWNLSNLRLNDSLESTGILSWLEAILKWCLEMIYKIIPNWGVSIIILTIFIKILLFPLTKKSSLSTLKMQEVQPLIKEVQDKYKDNPEKMNIELAKIYKEEGFSPMSGCLPMLLQFPLIFAMYNLFNNYFEFRGAMFIPGWIPDLSVGDSIYTLNFNIPFGIGNQIRLLPLIYLVSQLIFGRVTQSTNAANGNATQMKFMMYGMPLIFFFIFYNAPSGLLLYWTVSNALQLVQQMILNKVMKAKRAEMERNKENEKKVFVPRKKK